MIIINFHSQCIIILYVWVSKYNHAPLKTVISLDYFISSGVNKYIYYVRIILLYYWYTHARMFNKFWFFVVMLFGVAVWFCNMIRSRIWIWNIETRFGNLLWKMLKKEEWMNKHKKVNISKRENVNFCCCCSMMVMLMMVCCWFAYIKFGFLCYDGAKETNEDCIFFFFPIFGFLLWFLFFK